MNLQEEYDIQTQLGVAPPCYVRKVHRQGICGDKSESAQIRNDLVRTDVLSIDGGVLSVFYVTNAHDVIRVACSLNFARTGGTNVFEICLLAFTTEELCKVAKAQTADAFKCRWSQQNHWDVTLTEEDQVRIADLLIAHDRKPKRFSGNKVKAAWNAGAQDGCRSVMPNSLNCVCDP